MTVLDPIQTGEPVEHRGVVVLPLFPRRDPVAPYLTLDVALARGLRVTETSPAGAVPELAVQNPLDEQVLLYDGEELVGAKQNRILNVSVLVGARSTIPIPVSCVEEGRWRARSAAFDTAPQTAHAHLRRVKAERLASAPLARGIAQAEVWDEVRAKAARLAADSPTLANADTFRAHERALRSLEDAFPLLPGQSGALLALGGDLCLDYVSRPDAFERLWPKLRAGYLLDALERLDRPASSPIAIERFLAQVDGALASRGPSAGLGEDVRLRGDGVVGSGLELDGEEIQLCAFTTRDGGRTGRIARPSARR